MTTADEIDLTPLRDRTGPNAEASWREDIRLAAIAGGAPEEMAAKIAAVAPINLPAGGSRVEYALYYGWSRQLMRSSEKECATYRALHSGLAAAWPTFEGMAAWWMDRSPG